MKGHLMTQRDKLIEVISHYVDIKEDVNVVMRYVDALLLADRKRICEPLVNAYLNPDFSKMTLNGQLNRLHTGTVETLKLAGLTEE